MAKIQTVKFAQTNTTSNFIRGVGEIGGTFPSVNKTFDLAMFLHPQGVLMDIGYRGVKYKVLMPFGNFKIIELGPEVEALE